MVAGEPFQVQFGPNKRFGEKFLNEYTSGTGCPYGPATSTSSSTRIINGKMSRKRTTSYTDAHSARRRKTQSPLGTGFTDGQKQRTLRHSPRHRKVQIRRGINKERGKSPRAYRRMTFLSLFGSWVKTLYEQEAVLVTFKLFQDNQHSSKRLLNSMACVEELPRQSATEYESYRGDNYYNGVVLPSFTFSPKGLNTAIIS